MKKLSGFIIVAAVVLSGCSKGYYDINTNPNASTNASVDLVLANALKVTAGTQITNYGFLSEWLGYWGPSGGFATSSTDGASYKETTAFADANGLWSNVYDNLEDYDYIEKTATASNQYFYIAAAKTMKALIYQQLVDCFNNVPYSQALKGTANLTPKYDTAQSIYESLSTELGNAVTLFQRADAIGSPTQDILFAANTTKWAKFANSLRLRLLMRQSEMPGRSAYITTEIAKIVANGSGFLTTDAAVNPGYTNSAGKQNAFYGLLVNTGGSFTSTGTFWRAQQYSVTFCLTNNDNRVTRIYAPATGTGLYAGTIVGSQLNPGNDKNSGFGPGVLSSASQSAIIFSAAEAYLLQSEANLRGWLGTTGDAGTNFNSGVQASFTYLGAGSAAAYTSQAGNKQTNYGACTTFGEKLACIIRQRWMANNTVTPFEAWGDYRRLGMPSDIPLSIAPYVDFPAIPIRILYPAIEYQTNATIVGGQGTIDHHTSKIFWMP